MTSILSPVARIATMRRVTLVVVGAALLGVLAPTASARQQAAPVNTAQPTVTGSPARVRR